MVFCADIKSSLLLKGLKEGTGFIVQTATAGADVAGLFLFFS
jgi:hypothetical protein